jgi:hypothetical protein
MYARRFVVDITTAADGSATAYTDSVVNGRVLSIHYAKDGTTPFDNGVDFTITTETTGQNLWVETNVNAGASRAPRQATHSTAGAASLYAAGGTAVEDFVYAADERVKVVIAQGGNAKLGRFHILVG